jgi:hypothetical protein
MNEVDYKELLRKIISLVKETNEYDFEFMAEEENLNRGYDSFSSEEIEALKELSA